MSGKIIKTTDAENQFFASLNNWFKNSGKRQVDAASELGITQGSFNNIITRKRAISLSMMENIANILNQDVLAMMLEGRAILEGRDPNPSPPTVHGVDLEDLDHEYLRIEYRDDLRLYAGSGGAIEGSYDLSNSYIVVHRKNLSLKAAQSRNLLAFQVGGDSMEPTIAKNGIVIVDTTCDNISKIRNGKIYAFINRRDDEAWIKRLSLSTNTGVLVIESDNPSEQAISELPENIQLIGKVINSWREH